MSVPFSLADFLDMIASYNANFWPMQMIAYVFGMIIVVFTYLKVRFSNLVVAGILAFLWIWTGIIFNWLYFSQLFPLAISFAALFTLEGILLIVLGVFRKNVSFMIKRDLSGTLGGLFILYGMFGYPLIEYLTGRGYPLTLPFGLAPCPLTVFTLGLLLWSEGKWAKYLVVIPVIYALSGVVPVSFGIVEDVGLIFAGLITAGLFVYREITRHRVMIEERL